jgi:hypothetical protein
VKQRALEWLRRVELRSESVAMGKEKAGFLTPKAIGNRIKAKGLQKLRWCVSPRRSQARRSPLRLAAH